jgi:LacI family transcriptional regulator
MVRTTLKDIAKSLNISIGTVERAIHGNADINPDTKKRVLEKISELDYRPNKHARSLSVKNLKKVAVLLPDNSAFWHKVKEGIEAAAAEMSYFGTEVQIISLNRMGGGLVLSHLKDLIAGKADGVILIPSGLDDVAGKINELVRQGLKLVLLNDDLPGVERLSYVGPDHALIGRLAGELIGKFTLGRGKCLMVSCKRTGTAGLPVECAQRIEGFRQVLAGEYPDLGIAACEYDLYTEDAYGSIIRQLEMDRGITSIYSVDGFLCEAALAVKDFGVKDLVLVGHEMSDEVNRLLGEGIITAAICQNPSLQGYRAMKQMAEYLIDKRKPSHDSLFIDFKIYTKYNTYGKSFYL